MLSLCVYPPKKIISMNSINLPVCYYVGPKGSTKNDLHSIWNVLNSCYTQSQQKFIEENRPDSQNWIKCTTTLKNNNLLISYGYLNLQFCLIYVYILSIYSASRKKTVAKAVWLSNHCGQKCSQSDDKITNRMSKMTLHFEKFIL